MKSSLLFTIMPTGGVFGRAVGGNGDEVNIV